MHYEDQKYYHIFNRGANKQKIFYCDENYSYCLRLFKKYLDRYNVSMIAYCLMPNHYHLLIRQNEAGSISRFLQTVFNSYSQAFNRMSGHSGTLFEGRPKSVEVVDDNYAVRLCAYIHRNPVAAKLVSRPEDWRFSDYVDWIGMRETCMSDLSFRDSHFNLPAEYKDFVLSSPGNQGNPCEPS